jgi:D-glycero-alpha-D-manno-heptose-7-phosphate kinase
MIYKAPLRLSIAGGGTDVDPFAIEHGSAVINFAINTEITFEIEYLPERRKKSIEFFFHKQSLSLGSDLEFSKQLSKVFEKKFAPFLKNSLRISINNPVNSGSGLGASSTIVAGSIFAIGSELKLGLRAHKVTTLAHEIERKEMQRPGGFQDYYPAVFGGINFLERLGGIQEVKVMRVASSHSFRDFINHSLFCFSLGQQRKGEDVISDQIKRSKDKSSNTYFALKSQLDLVKKIRRSIAQNDFKSLLDLVDESYSLKKKFSPLITNPVIEEMERRLRSIGGKGIKVSGAGGGGHMFSFFEDGVPKDVQKILLPQMQILPVSLQEIGARRLSHE